MILCSSIGRADGYVDSGKASAAHISTAPTTSTSLDITIHHYVKGGGISVTLSFDRTLLFGNIII
jgi:hypothetical protein